MTDDPIATVAILTYNGEDYLERILSQLRVQEVDGDVELLVIDSGSTDSTLEIVGRNGRTLREYWDGEPRAFLGMTGPELPICKCLCGPRRNGGEWQAIHFVDPRSRLHSLGLLVDRT